MPSSILVLGKESTGKSQLLSSLTRQPAYSANFRGSTVTCDTYTVAGQSFIDTPGLVYQSDSATTQLALRQLSINDTVLVVAKATHLDEDLTELLPLVRGKRGAVAVTFWDKLPQPAPVQQALQRLTQKSGVSFIPLDARTLTELDRARVLNALEQPCLFLGERLQERIGPQITPRPTVLEHRYLGPLLAGCLLLLPFLLAVWSANTFAQRVDPLVQRLLLPVSQSLASLPNPLAALLVGSYGILTMGPLLFVWAVPTVTLYALILGAYKASGLIERVIVAVQPVFRPFGLSGRDLVRVLMGFGCNVPAVINTRACSSCTRQTCVSAIAFGSACSYQLGATLSVFSAAHVPWLALPYLLFLVASTLLYLRFTAPLEARTTHNALLIEERTFLEWPRWQAVWREARSTIAQFFVQALPIFLLITLVAALLDWIGGLTFLAAVLAPAMTAFRLPAEVALPVMMASVRKDGILLFAATPVLSNVTPVQLLTGVYLAGVLLPCLVTLLTIAREQSLRFAMRTVSQQAAAAVLFSLLLAWGSPLIIDLLDLLCSWRSVGASGSSLSSFSAP